MNPLSLRRDTGALWENFVISERAKRNAYKSAFYDKYFWRTYQQQEIDYLEERNQKLHAYEKKWKKEKVAAPKAFLDTYPDAEFTVIDQDNYFEFVS